MTWTDKRRLRTRMVPMRVLNLGLSRTGTTSLKIALEQLGLQKVYHPGFGDNDCDFWIAAMEAKFEGKGKPFGKAQWDHIFSDCDAVSDLPAIMFAEELVAAYPDAKVILTIRDIDSWASSMLRTICNPVYRSPYHRLTTYFNSQEAALCAMSDMCEDIAWKSNFPVYGRAYFEAHNSLVRRVVPAGKLLEFEAKQGWGPLCAFLDKPVPDTPYPQTYDVKAFTDDAYQHTFSQWKGVVKHLAVVVLPITLAAGAYWMIVLKRRA